MLQLTIKRTEGCNSAPIGAPILVANAAHAEIIDEQLQMSGLQDYRVLLEPFGRNTAPAIALAALETRAEDAMLVMSSDHMITDLPAFHEAIAHALPLVAD